MLSQKKMFQIFSSLHNSDFSLISMKNDSEFTKQRDFTDTVVDAS